MKQFAAWIGFVSLTVGLFGAGVWIGQATADRSLADGHGERQMHRASPEDIQFAERQAEFGIEFTHFDSRRDSLLPEDVGSGAGWADYDNDGDEDLFLVNCAGPFLLDPAELAKRPGNRMYRNDRGKFVDVTSKSGLGHVGWDYACLWFDYDNDGWLDLAVTHYDGVLLYRNKQDGTFDDVTTAAGLGDVHRFSLGMTSADFDHDGHLDLYVCGYVKFDREKARNRPLVAGRPAVWTNPTTYEAEPNVLFRNRGDGTFEDVTSTAGVANENGKSMQALFCDFDNDTWPDLYVANDVGTADVLYHNQHDGTFKDVSLEAGTHDRRASMGLAVGDVWDRGWMDLFVTHWVAEHHAMWKNRTEEFRPNFPVVFSDEGPASGLIKPKLPAYVGWGTGLFDFDNDGNLDLLVVNGSTIEDELTIDVLTNPKLMPQPPQVLRNLGNGKFIEVSDRAGPFFGNQRISRGAAFGDFDLDGRVDVAVVATSEPTVLLHNVTERPGHWVSVMLKSPTANRFGIGARVQVHAANRTSTREMHLGSSYLSSNSYRLHFGLGKASVVDWIEVHWPDGSTTRLENVPVDRVVLIEQ